MQQYFTQYKNLQQDKNKSKYKSEYAKRAEPFYYIGDELVTQAQDIGRSSQKYELGSP